MKITAGSWLLDGNILVFFYPDPFILSDPKRIFFNSSTSQLSLYSVQVNDSGLYVLQGVTPTVKAELELSVQGECPYTHNQKHLTNSLFMLCMENA